MFLMLTFMQFNLQLKSFVTLWFYFPQIKWIFPDSILMFTFKQCNFQLVTFVAFVVEKIVVTFVTRNKSRLYNDVRFLKTLVKTVNSF